MGSDSHLEIDASEVFYFLNLLGDKYHTLFVGWLREDFIQAFYDLDPESGLAYFNINVGKHTFTTYTDQPVYLLPYENTEALEFAGDDNELVLFPKSGMPSELGPPTIKFPTYWTKGVEPFFQFRLGNPFSRHVNGIWVPLSLEGGQP